MTTHTTPEEHLRAENTELRASLGEAEETLLAIRTGEVDSLVVETDEGPQIFSLDAAEAASNRFRGELLAQVSDSVIALDADQRVTYLNAAAERQYRVPASDALGRELSEIYTRQWPSAEAESAMWVALRKHGEWRGEIIHRMHDGRELQVEAWLTLLRADDGADAGMVTAIRDISERKRGEAELQRVSGLLDTLLDTAPIGFCFLDRDLRYVRINERLAEINGIAADAHVGRHIDEIVPDLVDTIRDVTGRILATGEAVLNHEFSGETPAAPGVTRFWNESWYPVRDSAGEIIGLGAVVEDITERKHAEEELRASEEFNRTVLENSPDCVNILDGKGRVQYINSNGLCQMEIDDSALFKNKFWWNLWGVENIKTVKDAVKKALQGETAHFQASGPTAKGTLKWWDVIVSPIPGIDGRTERLISVSRDITEQMNQAEALKKAHDELEVRVEERTLDLALTNAILEKEIAERKTAERQKIALLQRVANTQEAERSRIARDLHDQLGQRLTGLRLKLQWLMGVAGDNEEVRSGLLALSEMGQTLDDDVGFLTWELRPAIFEELGLMAALEFYVNEWGRRFAIPTSFGATGLADHRLDPEIEINLYRIVQEALNNVAKFARATQVAVLLQKRGNTITLIVEDDGGGFKVAKRSTSREAGHGFGLIGMQERTSLISGVLEIESAPGSGTSILVTIPINNESQTMN